MPDFRLISNGYVDATLSDQELTALFKNLRMLRKDSYNDFELLVKGHVAEETLREIQRLTGGSFAQWLEVNFDHGKGPISGVIRDVMHFLNNKQSHFTVNTSVRQAELSLAAAAKARSAAYSPNRRTGTGESFLRAGYKVEDYDLFRLMGAVGPALVGRLFLLVGGDTYYA